MDVKLAFTNDAMMPIVIDWYSGRLPEGTAGETHLTQEGPKLYCCSGRRQEVKGAQVSGWHDGSKWGRVLSSLVFCTRRYPMLLSVMIRLDVTQSAQVCGERALEVATCKNL